MRSARAAVQSFAHWKGTTGRYVGVEQWHLIIAGLSGGTAALRFVWRVWKQPGTPSLIARIWRWSLTTRDCEMDKQRMGAQLAARDKLIADLQHDLDRAVGIDSSRESREAESHHPQSNAPTTPLQRRSTDTTG